MSQLRNNTKFSLSNHYRRFYQSFRLGACGQRVWLDANVKLMRFPKNIYLGDDVFIKEGARLCACNSRASIRIGQRTTIGYHTFIFASEQISIGEDCMIAPFVYLVDSDHGTKKGQRMNQQPNMTAQIRIGDDVWIASGVTVLKGVSIGEGAVVAANSVVNRDVPPFTVYGGTPAKLIGERQ